MPKPSYTNKQIEVANILNSSVKDGVTQEVIDEIVTMVGEEAGSTIISSKDDTEAIIKLKILNEPDWRKRAILSAMLISKSLE
jgi:hypothetical protein